jgi:hypothetical protein
MYISVKNFKNGKIYFKAGPLNLQLAGNMLPANQYYVASGDI